MPRLGRARRCVLAYLIASKHTVHRKDGQAADAIGLSAKVTGAQRRRRQAARRRALSLWRCAVPGTMVEQSR